MDDDSKVKAKKIMFDFGKHLKETKNTLKRLKKIGPPGFSSKNEMGEMDENVENKRLMYSYFFKALDYSNIDINVIEEIFKILIKNTKSFNFFSIVVNYELGGKNPKIFFEFLNEKIKNDKKRKEIKKLVFKFLGYEFSGDEIISEVKVKEKEEEKEEEKDEIRHIVTYLFLKEELLTDNNIDTKFLLFNEEYKKEYELIRRIYLYYEKYSIISKLTGASIIAQQHTHIGNFFNFNPDFIKPFIRNLLGLKEIKKHEKLNKQLALIYNIISDKILKNVVFNIDFEYSADDVKTIKEKSEMYAEKSEMYAENFKLIEKVNDRIIFFQLFQQISDSISESILIKDDFKHNLKSIFQKDNYSEDLIKEKFETNTNSKEENKELLSFLKSITDITEKFLKSITDITKQEQVKKKIEQVKQKIEYLINLVENEILIAICNKSLLIKDGKILQNIKNILTAKNDDNVTDSYNSILGAIDEEKNNIKSLLSLLNDTDIKSTIENRNNVKMNINKLLEFLKSYDDLTTPKKESKKKSSVSLTNDILDDFGDQTPIEIISKTDPKIVKNLLILKTNFLFHLLVIKKFKIE